MGEDENADAGEPEIEGEDDDEDESESEEEKEPEKVEEAPARQTRAGKRKAQSAKVSAGKKDNPRGKHAEQDEAEEKRLAKSAMSKKFKRLDDKIQYGKRKEKAQVAKLAEKRKAHDTKPKGKAKGKAVKQPPNKKSKK